MLLALEPLVRSLYILPLEDTVHDRVNLVRSECAVQVFKSATRASVLPERTTDTWTAHCATEPTKIPRTLAAWNRILSESGVSAFSFCLMTADEYSVRAFQH